LKAKIYAPEAEKRVLKAQALKQNLRGLMALRNSRVGGKYCLQIKKSVSVVGKNTKARDKYFSR
jgi:hypothetical protein